MCIFALAVIPPGGSSGRTRVYATACARTCLRAKVPAYVRRWVYLWVRACNARPCTLATVKMDAARWSEDEANIKSYLSNGRVMEVPVSPALVSPPSPTFSNPYAASQHTVILHVCQVVVRVRLRTLPTSPTPSLPLLPPSLPLGRALPRRQRSTRSLMLRRFPYAARRE